MIKSFQTVLGFLSVFKVSARPTGDLAQVGAAAWAFPLVGAILGTILVIAYDVLGIFFPPFVTAIFVVALWIFLTGGLHLDGWADCWDAMAASVSPERRNDILKDSRLGTFGAVALVVLIGLKISTLAVENFSQTMLFLAPVIGRSMMVIVSYKVQCSNAGMAESFVSSLDKNSVITASVIGIGGSLLLAGFFGLAVITCAYIGSLCFKRLAESRLTLFNGDVIGSICEFSEVLVLLIGCAKW